MEFVIGIVSSIFTKAAEYTISPIINHVKYLSNHQQNVETLKDQAEKLKDERDRVQHSVDAAQRNGEEIERDVNNWMSAVDRKIPEQVEKVMQDEEKAKKKCFIGLCPNFWTRYKHSLKAAAEAKAVAELLEQGKFGRVSYPVPLQSITVPPGKGYEEFESRTLILNGIMEALKDDSIIIVGVHGAGGIGKTTLVKEIARKVKGKLFDSVVIATVTQAIDIKRIQNEIADFLDLKFEKQSMVGKAIQLRQRLKKEERILVILDDIWGKVDIEEVGIPLGDEHKGCKLLLTSRELNVLSNEMDAQENFPIGFLKEKEAWDLFKKMAGNCDESCDLKPIAMKVAKKCAGLPIAIATVVGALKNKSLFEWKNALRELERPSSSNFKGITAAYSAIELSFKYLESEEVKLTFLLCSVIGHNGLVEDLVRYTLGLGLFDGVHTMEEARNKVLTVVANLKASALLLESYNDERFGIHDVVWDAAIAIALKDYRMIVLRDHAPKEWSDKEKMKTWSVISLRCPQIIANLPKEMECSGLSFFHMAYDGEVKIPLNFFKQTEGLKALDLVGMQFPSLPESIIHLADLRMLCLKKCAVDDITNLGELKSLQVLNLSQSGIKELPKEMAQLTQLRLLDLRGCRELKIIPPNVLSGLSELEELYMSRSFVEWEKGGVVENERKNASLDELNNLPCLTTLYVHILDVQMIPKHRFVETLDRFRIFVGNYGIYDCCHNYESPKALKLMLYTNIDLDNGMKMLLIKTEDLCLEGLEGVKNVLVELNNGKDLPNLKRLHVKNGKHVQYIKTNKIGFSELCFITLENLPQLVSFCSPDERCSTMPFLFFNKQTCHWVTNLRRLIIKGCGKLEHLLSPSLARSLVQLQCFEIEDCNCLRDIILTEEIEEERKDVIRFPQLNSLRINGLPNLIFFSSGNHNIEFPLLKELWIMGCPKLIEFISQNSNQSGMHALFSEKVAVPSLEDMNISDLSNVKMIFYNDLAPGSFKNLRKISVEGCGSLKILFPVSIAKDLPQLEHLSITDCGVEEIVSKGDGVEDCIWVKNLRRLIIEGCGKLEHLLSPSLARSLVQLQYFQIADCKCLRDIILTEEIEEERKDVICFPQLNSLHIDRLPNLIFFNSGNHNIEFPLLKELWILGCPKLIEFISQNSNQSGMHALFSEKVAVPSLEDMNISDLSNVKMIFYNDLAPGSFKNLRKISVEGCGSLKILFPVSIAKDLPQLEHLSITDCGVEEIVSKGDGVEDCIWVTNLRSLIIKGCGKLEHLLSPSLARSLVQLQYFRIADCKCLRDIILTEEIEEERKDVIRFPQLNSLRINGLPNLIFFSSGNHNIEFPLLKVLRISCCPKLIEFISQNSNQSGMHALFSEKVAVPSLEDMKIWDLSNVKMILYNDLAPGSFKNIRKVSAWGCGSLKNLFPVSIAKDLPQLEQLRITDCGVEEIVSKGDGVEEQPVRFEFPQVSYLEVSGVDKLKCFYEGQHTIVWPMLKKLRTDSSALLKIVASEHLRLIQGNEQPVLLGEEVIPKLEELELGTFGDMDQFPPDLFQHIKVFAVSGGSPFSLFPFVRRFYNLERLELSYFDFKYLVPCKGDAGTLSPIRNLKLVSARNLKHILRKDSELDHILSNLQTLTVLNCDGWIHIRVFSSSLQNLTILDVSRCEMMTNLVTPSVLKNLVQLTTIKVEGCTKMTEIVGKEGECHQTIVVSKLKCLKLCNLKRLTRFCPWYYNFEFPCLEEIVVQRCPWLNIFSEGVLSTPQLQSYTEEDGFYGPRVFNISDTFPESIESWTRNPQEILGFENLSILQFYKCSSLKYIFTPSMLLSLNQLSSLEVKECSSMEQVVREEEEAMTQKLEEAMTHKFTFLSLDSVTIGSCSNLTNFHWGSQALEFPQLRDITIAECPKMTGFSSSVSRESGDASENVVGKWGIYDNTATFFSNKVVIPRLKSLDLSSMNIHKIWHHSSSPSIGCLNYLQVKRCHNLKYLFPSFLVKDLVQLQRLEILDCNMMEQVIFTDGLVEEHQGRNQMFFFNLQTLWLNDLPKLTSLCFENYFEFHCLEDLELRNCPLLKTFISKCVPGDEPQIGQHVQASYLEVHNSSLLNEKVVFPSLENLWIQNCDSLEEIIELAGHIADESQSTSAAQSIVAETVTTKFVFPKLINLGLDKVPRLKSFYSRMHTTQWPSLKQMAIIECPRVQIFTPQCPVSQVGISNQQPLFCVNEDTFPVLEALTLKTNDMVKGICDGQLSLQCFQNLKHLNLQFFPETSTTLPYSFIRSLPMLHKLVIDNASICQIVQSEGLSDQERHTSAFYQLKELSLSQLPKLTLKTFEPSLLSFKNLTTLEVSRCHGFINLLTCSTAKCLTLLERLGIDDCEMIEEIIACEAEEIQGGIVFPKLKYLQLSCLPRLASFSLAHHSLEFPVLPMVKVTKCPKMRNFCQGDLSTPRLEKMLLTRDEEGELQWEGDLNTTIKHMFDEMNVQNSEVTEVTDQLPKLE